VNPDATSLGSLEEPSHPYILTMLCSAEVSKETKLNKNGRKSLNITLYFSLFAWPTTVYCTYDENREWLQ
jgi:hypothetical protein